MHSFTMSRHQMEILNLKTPKHKQYIKYYFLFIISNIIQKLHCISTYIDIVTSDTYSSDLTYNTEKGQILPHIMLHTRPRGWKEDSNSNQRGMDCQCLLLRFSKTEHTSMSTKFGVDVPTLFSSQMTSIN